jgi:hypothetical protein
MLRAVACLLVGMVAAPGMDLGGHPAAAQELSNPRELYRVRITNSPNGAIELSSDRGQAWEPLGKVTRAAVAAAAASPIVSIAPAGSVAGVGSDSLLFRLPPAGGQNRTLRLLASGEPANTAAIVTDIPERGSLFRCLAPTVGSRLLLDRDPQPPVALPAGYTPRLGDRLLIVVSGEFGVDPPSVTIENKVGGEVVLAATGGIPKVLAKVKQPLTGIGRYAGTERAGTGNIVGWTPTAVTVSTAGRLRQPAENGQAAEERGGFVIQPAEPRLQGATHSASQLILEAVPEGNTKPPVARFFGLAASLSNGDPVDTGATRVEVKIDEGAWEPVPDLRGAVNADNMAAALKQALGADREVKEGITDIRLTFGTLTSTGLKRRILLAVTPAAPDLQRNIAKISADVMGEGISLVVFYLNGRQAKVTNIPPYEWIWDTRNSANGEHLIEIRGLDSNSVTVTTVVTKVIVDN